MIFSFKPQSFINHLPEGTHEGIIQEISYIENAQMFWFKILVDQSIFTCSFSIQSPLFNNFALQYVDENGNFSTENLIGTNVQFVVKDLGEPEQVRSKVTALKAIEN